MTKRGQGKIKSDFGINDYYKFYSQTIKNPKPKDLFTKIIYNFNKEIVDCIINEGLEFIPIKTQFRFCIRKNKRSIQIKNNKLINTNPVDWKTTLDLWKEDPEAKEKKLIIRHNNYHSSKYIFRIMMVKGKLNYLNKKYFKFKPCRSFQRNLAKRILDKDKDVFDAYKQY